MLCGALCVLSYKQTNPDVPDCTGPPMSLHNKFTGEIQIPYTYSIQFKVSVSSVVLKPEHHFESRFWGMSKTASQFIFGNIKVELKKTMEVLLHFCLSV